RIGDRANPSAGNGEVGELRPPRSVGGTRGRVVELEIWIGKGAISPFSGKNFTEIADAHFIGRDRGGEVKATPVGEFLVCSEKEELLFQNRAAERAAVYIMRERWFHQPERIVGEGVGVQLFIIVELESGAMELVSPRLGHYGLGCASGHTGVGVEVVGSDVDSLDGLRRLDIPSVVRQPDVYRHGAINSGGVAVRLRAVDPGAHRSARRVNFGILEYYRRRARDQVEQCLIVAVLVQRQRGHLCGI